VSVTNLPQWIGGRLKSQYRTVGVGFQIDGLLREQAAFDEQALVRIPDYLSFSEAASLPCAAVTAWAALTNGRSLEAGETVLVQGSGGVSLFALQFAKASGARVIATTSSMAKADRLRKLGADEVIDYNARPDWDVVVRELTGGVGVARVVEVTGPSTLQRSVNCTSAGGRVFLVGFLSGFEGGLNPMSLLTGSVGVEGVSIGSRANFESLLDAMEVHAIHPVIDVEFPFAEFKKAYRHMEAGRYFGKIVITID
jgi:NADPH:quinone reductase-like Zn-dependent oxidoreductase